MVEFTEITMLPRVFTEDGVTFSQAPPLVVVTVAETGRVTPVELETCKV